MLCHIVSYSCIVFTEAITVCLQEEVARRIDLDRTTIGKYENDACVPSSTTLARLVEIYCTDANYILYGKEMKVMNISRVQEEY